MPSPKRRLLEEPKGAQDTASTAYATLQRAPSASALTCDSSCCTLCQPNLPESLQASQDPFLPLPAHRSTRTVGLEQLEQQLVDKRATGAAEGYLCAAWPSTRTSSPSSSQSAQDVMFLEEQGDQIGVEEPIDADYPEASRVQGSAVGSTPSSMGQYVEVDGGDDFVQVERADLQHGYASSTNLTLQHTLANSGGHRKRQCTAAPLSARALPGDSSGSEAEKVVSSSTVDRSSRLCWQWRSEWEGQEEPCAARFTEVATFERPLHSQHKRQHADIVCGVEFSPDGNLLACAGVAKQIRVYPLGGVRSSSGDMPITAAFIHRLPSKMSSIAWCPYDEGVVTVGDYDGVVAQVHIASGHLVADVDEHSGRRVWSVVHSLLRPHLCCSTGDDGSARLHGGRGLSAPAGHLALPRRGPVCGAAFCPEDEHALALAGADRCAYIFDLRRTAQPLHVMSGHSRPVSYVRFMGRSRVATASTDSSLALWDLHMASGPRLFRRYEGHTNVKNFVGLSVREDDELMACGSENGQAVAYHRAWSAPLAAHDFSSCAPANDVQHQACMPVLGAAAWHPPVRALSAHEQPPSAGAGSSRAAAWHPTVRALSAHEQPPSAGAGSSRAAARQLQEHLQGSVQEMMSAVCWWPGELGAFGASCRGPVLAAAKSDGDLRLLTLVNAC